MDSLVFPIRSLIESASATDGHKTVGQTLLASTTPKVLKVLRHNRDCMAAMCPDCRQLCKSLNKASITDLAAVLRKSDL